MFQPLESGILASLPRYDIFNVNKICSVRREEKGFYRRKLSVLIPSEGREKNIHICSVWDLFWTIFKLYEKLNGFTTDRRKVYLKFGGLDGNIKINRLRCCEDQTSDDVQTPNHHSTDVNKWFFQTCKHVQVPICHTSPKFRIDDCVTTGSEQLLNC